MAWFDSQCYACGKMECDDTCPRVINNRGGNAPERAREANRQLPPGQRGEGRILQAKRAAARAVAYCRFSPRPGANECESCDAQIELAREWCTRCGATLAAADIFRDDDASGGDFERPGLWDAIEALGRGDVLVVEKADRLARSLYLDEWIRSEVAERGARIVAIRTPTDDTPEGVLLRQILAAFSEYRRKADALLTQARSRRHQASGRRMSANLPYGWAIDPDGPKVVNRADGLARPARMIPCEAERAIIAKILDLSAKGLGSQRIKRVLEGAGIPFRGRETWARKTITSILRREQGAP